MIVVSVIILVCSSLAIIGDAKIWSLTNWNEDTTGNDCNHSSNMPFKFSDCDKHSGKNVYCSASVRACYCQNTNGVMKPAKDTDQNNAFWLWCKGEGYRLETGQKRGHIDSEPIPSDWRNRCNRCTYKTCDQYHHPDCEKDQSGNKMGSFCGSKRCISANGKKLEAIEVDSCPSNHQKNVAKCCLFGGSWCSCVDNHQNWLDVNYKASEKLGCLGDNCKGRVTWLNQGCTGTDVYRSGNSNSGGGGRGGGGGGGSSSLVVWGKVTNDQGATKQVQLQIENKSGRPICGGHFKLKTSAKLGAMWKMATYKGGYKFWAKIPANGKYTGAGFNYYVNQAYPLFEGIEGWDC